MPKKLDPKKERKRGSHVSKKEREKDRDDSREKTITSRSMSYPSIHLSIHFAEVYGLLPLLR